MHTQSSNWQAHDENNHIPNAETIVAMEEADEIIERAQNGQDQSLTLDEMFKELGI